MTTSRDALSYVGSVACRDCIHRGARADEHDWWCRRDEFQLIDYMGEQDNPRCSYVNASKNCNGFEPREE